MVSKGRKFFCPAFKELEGNKHLLWLDEMKKYIPMDRKLKILDVGTGTGFFAFLLADQGHDVTGIDLTPDMIREAQRMSKALGIPADFYVMDAEMPDFPPGSFDVIVSRNLTWALPHMDRAYQAWRRLLKKDGVLINFDGDYCREKEPRVLPAHHAHTDIAPDLMDEYEHLKEELKDSQQPSPSGTVSFWRGQDFPGYMWIPLFGFTFMVKWMNFIIRPRFLLLPLMYKNGGLIYGKIKKLRPGKYCLLV